MTLTVVDQQIQTRLPDNTSIETWVSPWSNGKHRIGEKKRIAIEYSSDIDISGFTFYVSPAMFVSNSTVRTFSGKGDVFYSCQLPSVLVHGDVYSFSINTQLPFVANLPTYDNYNCYIVTDSTTSFILYVEFYMIVDFNRYVGFGTNKDKFLKDYIANTITIAPNNSNLPDFNFTRDVYGSTFYEPRIYVYCEDSTDISINTSIETKFTGFKAGWYFKNPQFAQADLTNQYFVIKRGGNAVTNFSVTELNNVEIFTNTDNVINPITHFVAGIIRVDTDNDGVDYLTNYEADFQRIVSSSTATGKIQAPMTDPTVVSGVQYKATFNVSNLVFGAKYRLIGIAYSFHGSTRLVNSFISPEIICDAVPCYDGNGLDFSGKLSDYQNEYSGNNLECVVEERMKSEIQIDFAFNKWKDDLFNRLGLVSTNDIRRYLTKISVEFYDTQFYTIFQNIKNIYDYKEINKNGFNSYTSQPGMTISFTSNSANFIYEWRNRFEGHLNCISSFLGNTPISPQASQDWGGKTIKIKWSFVFTYDDYVAPFSDTLIYEQKIRVKTYDKRISVTAVDEDDEAITKTNYCKGDNICVGGFLTGSVDDPNNEDFKLISNIKPLNSSVSNILESEVWEGDELNQLNQIDIVNQDEDFVQIFDDIGATFCLKTDNLVVNSQYEISVIAKKV